MQPQPQPQAAQDPKAFAIYRKLLIAGMKIVHDQAVTPQLIAMMKGADPAQGIARATSVVLTQMKEKIQGANPNVVYAAAPAIAAMVADLGRAAGIFQPTRQLLQQAVQIIVQQEQSAPAPAAPPAGLINQAPQ